MTARPRRHAVRSVTSGAGMLAEQRQERILAEVRAHGAARVSDLVGLLGVSDMTVRRDIAVLAGKGLVNRVHGGATLAGRTSEEPGFAVKFALRTEQKHAIGRAAAALVEPGSSVAISAGTTTVRVAEALRGVANLTVVTNSIPAADALHDPAREDLTILLVGGMRTPSDALVGPVAVNTLRTLHVDWLFLGVHGIDERVGLTTPNLVEAETDRALVEAANHVVVVADSSKWGVIGLSTIAGLDRIDVLVTDDGLDPEARRVLRSRVGEVVLVPAVDAQPKGATTA